MVIILWYILYFKTKFIPVVVEDQQKSKQTNMYNCTKDPADQQASDKDASPMPSEKSTSSLVTDSYIRRSI